MTENLISTWARSFVCYNEKKINKLNSHGLQQSSSNPHYPKTLLKPLPHLANWILGNRASLKALLYTHVKGNMFPKVFETKQYQPKGPKRGRKKPSICIELPLPTHHKISVIDTTSSFLSQPDHNRSPGL